MDHRNTNNLNLQINDGLAVLNEPVASPMTQLTMNFESIHTHTPTGPSKGTPRRKLSLGEFDNNAATPILSTSISRTLSSESGYCPSPDRPGSITSFDSPSADFINARRRSYPKVIRKPGFMRSISSPLTSRFNEACEKNPLEDENNNKENEFQFAKPVAPVHRSASSTGKRMRPTSAPPELSPGGSMCQSGECDDFTVRFSVDEDDDGFIDYNQLEQNEDEAFTMSSAVAGLMTAPLTKSRLQNSSNENSQNTTDVFEPIKSEQQFASRAKRSKSLSMKRPVAPRDESPEERKRLRARCSSAVEASWNSPLLVGLDRVPGKSPLMRSQSLVETKTFTDIGKLLTPGSDHSNISGDLSTKNILPTIKGQHRDLKTITPETACEVLDHNFAEIDNFYIIDCRYPYEYEGGHIKNALNLHTKEEVYNYFVATPKCCSAKRAVLIFHCEFSSKRAPNMYRYLRNKDRDIHRQCYPKLFYPEMYVIQGGYKAFYESCKSYCDPMTYRPMNHENFTQELKRFSKRSKSWTEGQTVRKSYRQGLKF